MRTVQTIGVPTDNQAIDADAIVVALKSRTIPAQDAIAQSLQAYAWLKTQGVEQIYFKYCSTFDSTPKGNIGPVTEALMDAIDGKDQGFTIVCPAFLKTTERFSKATCLWAMCCCPTVACVTTPSRP